MKTPPAFVPSAQDGVSTSTPLQTSVKAKDTTRFSGVERVVSIHHSLFTIFPVYELS